MTFAELRAASPAPSKLRALLNEELQLGRVERRGNSWRLVSSAFSPDVLEALAEFHS